MTTDGGIEIGDYIHVAAAGSPPPPLLPSVTKTRPPPSLSWASRLTRNGRGKSMPPVLHCINDAYYYPYHGMGMVQVRLLLEATRQANLSLPTYIPYLSRVSTSSLAPGGSMLLDTWVVSSYYICLVLSSERVMQVNMFGRSILPRQ